MKRVFGYVRWCEHCAKRCYVSRKAARRAARRAGGGMQAYPCPVLSSLWHFGHIPPAVRRGLISKGEWKASAR